MKSPMSLSANFTDLMYVWFVANPVVFVENINADRYLDTLIYNVSFIIGCLIKGEIFPYATIHWNSISTSLYIFL